MDADRLDALTARSPTSTSCSATRATSRARCSTRSPYWFDEGFPETRERYSEAELRGEGWTLLAQFDSAGDLMFGDAGALYYVLPEADLRERRFDRAMGIMQCSLQPRLQELALDRLSVSASAAR